MSWLAAPIASNFSSSEWHSNSAASSGWLEATPWSLLFLLALLVDDVLNVKTLEHELCNLLVVEERSEHCILFEKGTRGFLGNIRGSILEKGKLNFSLSILV